MTITITATLMSSDETAHTARWVKRAAADGGGAWIVSWLPTRLLTYNQSVTAMTIAEVVGAGKKIQMWPHIENWARELHLESAADAVRRVGGES